MYLPVLIFVVWCRRLLKNNMNIALTILCFWIFGFVHEGNSCCCTISCYYPSVACNLFGCDCKSEKCWYVGNPPAWCPHDERCSAKKFRNKIEVN